MAIHQRSPVRGIAPAVWPLLGLFLSSGAAVLAQTQPPGPTPARPVGSAPMWSRQASPDLLYTAARPPELTYTNSTYGISFRFPSNFYFDKLSRIGPAAQRNVKRHGDPEEILLASVVIPLGFGAGTNASGADLLVGVNPGLSRESCAALTATDKQTMGRARNLSAGGLELSGRSTIEENVPPGPMDTYRREYTGYANGVCYEFEVGFALINPARLRSPWPVAPADVGRLYAELEAMILTAQFTKPIPAAKPAQTMTEHVTYPWETSLPFPRELSGLGDMADWKIVYPTQAPGPIPLGIRAPKICGRAAGDAYMWIIFNDVPGAGLEDGAAEAAAAKLNNNVLRLIREKGWRPVSAADASHGEAARCYEKDSVYIETTVFSGRCTALSGCGAKDAVTLSVYVPIDSPTPEP